MLAPEILHALRRTSCLTFLRRAGGGRAAPPPVSTCTNRKVHFGEVRRRFAADLQLPVNLNRRTGVEDVAARATDAVGDGPIRLLDRGQRSDVFDTAKSSAREVDAPDPSSRR